MASGYGAVAANLSRYRTNVPNGTDNDYWNGFQFSDDQGNANQTCVNRLTSYSEALPSQGPGLFTLTAPV